MTNMYTIWGRILFVLSLCCTLTLSAQTIVASAHEVSIPVIKEKTGLNKVDTKVKHNVTIKGDDFMLDGEPLHIMSGSLHYFRLPAEYWQDRLRKFKAAGLNTVSTYVEWSYHEPEEREYKFEGDRDIAKFIQLAAEEGLHVLLRPGPYICAERDLGGLPYWLLGKYPNIKLRTTDKDFMEETRIWMKKLFEQVGSFLFGNGGPIILVQVENEYGSYGSDKAYREQLRDVILEHVGTNALLYTTDGPSVFKNGAVDGALATIDFGVGTDVPNVFRELREYMPNGPLMNSEFYPGWLTHWGESLQHVSTQSIIKTLKDMIEYKVNVNFYMFFGGSNFEFTTGANKYDRYQSDITSYDYDAPLTEAGDPTEKYYAIRDTLKEYNFEAKDLPVPLPSHKAAYGPLSVKRRYNLLTPEGRSTFGKKYKDVTGSVLPTFEELRQRGGLILYETNLEGTNGILTIEDPRDLIYVYVDDMFAGIINRLAKKYSLPLSNKPNSRLSLLVENQGRINFGNYLHDFKGILSTVDYNGKPIDGKWSITGYPLEELPTPSASPLDESNDQMGPILYEGQFTLPADEEPLDTYLDPTGWGKGYIWVNGHNLGRYWPTMGPQVTLYLPGVWLHAAPATNYIQILELESLPASLDVQSLDYAILNRTSIFRSKIFKY